MIEREEGRYRSKCTDHEIKDSIKSGIESLSDSEKNFLSKMLKEVGGARFDNEDGIDEGDLCLWNALKSVEYKTQPVDMETFLYDDYYLGETGRTLYPCWAEDLKELFNGNYYEAVIGGAIGTGKTTMAQVAVIRMVYEISCMVDPQRSFGLEKGTDITFQNVSSVKTLAEDAIIGGIASKIGNSPYFMENFKPDICASKIKFPGNINVIASASDMKSLLSLNTFGGILDEVNFIGQTKKRAGGDVGKMEKLYTQTIRRMKSRYNIGGKLPGILLMISSKNLKSSFTEKKIIQSLNNPNLFVREYSLWEVKSDRYSRKKFFVFAGNSKIHSYVVGDESKDNILRIRENIRDNEKFEGCKLIKVPVDFKKDFEDDTDSALKDIAGIAIDTISRFIYRGSKIEDAVDDSRSHPCPDLEWVANDPLSINWNSLVKKYYTSDNHGNKDVYIAPKINPEAIRHVHIDTSEVKDCTGLTIAHIAEYKTVKRKDIEGNIYSETVPFIVVDFMLRIVPPPGDSIILSDIRTIIYAFMDHGYNIGYASTDTYQSLEMRQYLEKKGVDVEAISVDRTPVPYKNLRSALYEDRIKYYDYSIAKEELEKLIYDREKQKVDHLENESKDVADSLAGVTHSLETRMSIGIIMPEIGISEYDGDDDVEDDNWVLEKGSGEMIKDNGSTDVFLPVI